MITIIINDDKNYQRWWWWFWINIIGDDKTYHAQNVSRRHWSDYAGKDADGEQEARADPKALAGGMSSDYQVLPNHRLRFSNTL